MENDVLVQNTEQNNDYITDDAQDNVYDDELDSEIDDFMSDDDLEEVQTEDVQDDVQPEENPIFKMSDGTELKEEEISGMMSTLTEITQGNIPDEFIANVPEVKMLREIAQQNGMNPIQYLMSIAQQNRAMQEQALAQQFIEQGIEPQIALRYASIELQNREFQTREQQNFQRRQEEQQQQKAMIQGWNTLQQRYPEFAEKYPEFEDFPQEMVQGLESGLSPIEAYQHYLITEQKRQTKDNALQAKNKQREIGSVRGVGDNNESDPFLQGFM